MILPTNRRCGLQEGLTCRSSANDLNIAIVCVIYEQSDAEVEHFVSNLNSLSGGPYALWLVVTNSERTLSTTYSSTFIVHLPENVGWTGGANEGARRAQAAGYQNIMFMNTDVRLIAADLVTKLLAALRSEPSVGLVSPGIVSSVGEDRIWYRGATLSTKTWITRHPGITGPYRPTHRVVLTQVPNGCCLVVRRQVLDQVGGFDPELFAYFDEADLAHRAASAGWQSAFVDSPLLAHDHHGRELGAVAAYYFGRNPLILAKKHLRAWRQAVVVLAQLGAAPYYLFRSQGMTGKTAYVRGVSHGLAHLLGRTHTGRGHR